MKVSIENVLIEGFLSIGEPTSVKIEKGLTSIIGENRTDNFSTSNGSGKSSIIEAIVWCLSGSTSRGIKNDAVINQFYDKGCKVVLTMSIDNSKGYRITRTRGGSYGNTLKLEDYYSGVDISGNTPTKSQAILDELLPFSYEDLTTLIILSQGMPGKLSSQKPSGRKSILEGIASYSDAITSLSNSVSKRYDEIDKKFHTYTHEISQTLGKVEATRSSIEYQGKLLAQELERASSFAETVKAIEAENLDIEEKVSKASAELSKLNLELEEKKEKLDSERNEYNSLNMIVNNLSTQKVQCNNELDKNEESIRLANKDSEALKSAKCFTCGHDLTDATMLDRLRAENSDKIKTAELNILNIKDNLSKLIPEIETNKLKVNHANDQIKVYTSEVSTLSKSVEELRRLTILNKKAIPTYVDNTENYRAEIHNLEIQVKELEDKMVELEKSRADLAGELEVLKKINYDVSRGEFRTYVLQKAVKAFNTILSHISIAIMKDAPVVLEFDGNNVEIKYKTKYYEQMSGGERNRIDIALELTKRKYKSMVTGLEFNMLVMDEVIDGLDSFGISAIFDAVEISGSCDSFLVISHRKDIELDYNRVIKVIKEDNLSRIEVM